LFFLLLDVFGRELSQKIISKPARSPEIKLEGFEKGTDSGADRGEDQFCRVDVADCSN
jgi:hypothetical protein